MAPRGESMDSRVARLEEAIIGFRDDRAESRADRKDIISRLDGLSQTMQSTGATVASLALEKCGERLDRLDVRVKTLEEKTVNLHVLEDEIMFWRRLLGGGFRAAWKIAAVILSSGVVGGVFVKIIWPH